MWPDRLSNPGPLTYESGALPNALRGPALGSVASDLSLHCWARPLLNGLSTVRPLSLDSYPNGLDFMIIPLMGYALLKDTS